MRKILWLLFLLPMLVVGQLDTIHGEITHVDYTHIDGIQLTILNDESGELISIITDEYIRNQKQFWIDNGRNVLPPPLHVTDIWTEDNIIYFTTSEPVQECTLWLREYRWDGFETSGHDITEHEYWKWASQTMVNSAGYITTHSYGIPRQFLGINWSWNLVVVIKNIKGETAESEMIRFKTNGKRW